MSTFFRVNIACLVLALLVACAPIGPYTITLVADGETRRLTTDTQTVADFLAQANVTLDQDDRVEPAEVTFLSDDLTVRVIRVEVQRETVQQVIPYGRETVRDMTIPVGETRLLRAGVNGMQEIIYAVTLENGIQVDRREVQRVTLQRPQNEVVLIGAQEEISALPISGTIAYLSAHSGWVVRSTSGNRRRLTSSGDLDGRVFALSPDGSQLLFTRTATETNTLNSLWMVDTMTVEPSPVRLQVDDVLWAEWAHDGERIAYSTGSMRDAAPGWEAANDLFIGTPRASDGQILGRRRILSPSPGGTYGWWGTTFAWSPDAEFLAYSRADEVGAVRLYNGETTPFVRFPPYRTYSTWAWTPAIAWSPEGELLATVRHNSSPTGETSEDSPVFDLLVLGVEVSRNQVITSPLAAELVGEVGMWAAPSFSPDGNWIAFGRARIPYTSHTSSYDLYLVDRDGSGQRILFPNDEREQGLDYPAVAWDPAGGQLLTIYQGDLYLVSIEGAARRLTEDGGITAVRWAGGRRGSEATESEGAGDG